MKDKDSKEKKEGKEPFKKFQFFDRIQNEQEEKEPDRKAKFSLDDFIPIQMKTINKFLFIVGSLQNQGLKEESEPETTIIKVYKNTVIEEYKFFSKQVCDFHLYKFKQTTYLSAIGIGELEGSNKQKAVGPLLKIFDISNCFNKEASNTPSLINLFSINEKDVVIPDLKSITCFAINESNTIAAVGLNNGKVVIISAKVSLEDTSPRNIRYLFNKAQDDKAAAKEAVTNIRFCIANNTPTLLVTTVKEMYYYKVDKLDEKKKEPEVISESGIQPFCLDYAPEKNVIAYSNDSTLGLYGDMIKGPSWSFEGCIKYLYFFNDYIVFLSYKNMESILQIFDLNNKYLAYFENTFDKILNVACDKENVFVLFEADMSKEVKMYQEKDNKEKFETFYKKKFYDTAYTYAKTLNYDGKTLAEISHRHAQSLYKDLEYEKSIKEYIRTINYLDPSYVIQLFLDGTKLDFLIYYLEGLHENARFKENCPHEEMKDYTALLLNCYIKQKQLDKLKDFLEKIDGNEKLIDIGTAIEVCKESDQSDIALNIATKCQITDSSIQILIELQEDYLNGLNSIINEDNLCKRYKLFIKYGEKLLEHCPVETNKAIQNLIETIIGIRQGNNEVAKLEIMDIKYETITHIYLKKERDLEQLLKFIMEKDINCPISIIHRQIEVYCKHKNSKELGNLLNKKEYIDRIDKNYILLLLATNDSKDEIVLLSEKMNLKHELFQMYIKNNAQQKIIEFCKATGKDDPSIWVQSLAYFINKYAYSNLNEQARHQVEEYIQIIIKQVLDNDIVSPFVLFGVLGTVKNINIAIIKDILTNHLGKLQKMYDENKKVCDQNYKQIDKLQNEVRDLNQKSKLFNTIKCSICSQHLYIPSIHFFCNHSFHPNCLNLELSDNMNKECPLCTKLIAPIFLKLKQIETNPVDPNVFFAELINKPKKTDLIAQYLSKGIFDMNE